MVTNHVYAIAGAKGGVGKTTTSINLAASLADESYRTVVVELDLAMANLVDFLDFQADISSEPTFHDVLAGDAPVEDATYEIGESLSIVPSGTDIEGYTSTDLDRLPEVVETLRWRNDVVLLDTPAGLSEEVVEPLRLADDAVVVSTPRVSAVRNAENTLALAERVETPVFGLVLTKSGTGASPGANRIAEFLDVELLGHVPEDNAVPHAQDRGEPVTLADPNCGAAMAYRKIARRLVETDRATTDRRSSPNTADAPTRTVDAQHDPVSERSGSGAITDAGTDAVSTGERENTVVDGVETRPNETETEATTRDSPEETTAGTTRQTRSDGGSADDESIGRQIRSLLGF